MRLPDFSWPVDGILPGIEVGLNLTTLLSFLFLKLLAYKLLWTGENVTKMKVDS